MDSIDYDNVKAEKANAQLRFQSIGLLLRITEICVALLFLCWIFTSLPFAVRISGDFIRRLSCLVSTPLFVFLLTNSILLALLTTKSTGGPTLDGGAEADIYDAFIRSGENRFNSSDGDLTEETIDKQMIDRETDLISNSNPTVARDDHVTTEPEQNSITVTESEKDHPPSPPPPTKVYRRSKTETSAKESTTEKVSKPLLRRSKTEKCRKIAETCEEVPFPEDNLTNEEFQRTIEAFIAKQLIFRRRESLSVVIPT